MTTTLWAALESRLPNLEEHISSSARATIRDQTRRAQTAAANAESQLAVIRRDPNLSTVGKQNRSDAITNTAAAELNDARERITQTLQDERRHHEPNAAWPRSTGTDADREARLANARADLDRLLATVQPGHRSERLEYAVRNGTEAMRELILGERYAERVLWPSLPDGNIDAIAWAATRPTLLAEHHPGGDTARRSLKALAALDTAGRQVETIAMHATQADLDRLTTPSAVGT